MYLVARKEIGMGGVDVVGLHAENELPMREGVPDNILDELGSRNHRLLEKPDDNGVELVLKPREALEELGVRKAN